MTIRSVTIAALLVAIALVRMAPAASAAPAPAAIPGCVAALKDVHTGSGAKSFASHYVTAGSYGYGEFLAGSFGGQSLWQKRGTSWCRVETGTTVLDRKGIAGAGVPASVADALLAKMKAGHELAPPVAPTPLGGVRHR